MYVYTRQQCACDIAETKSMKGGSRKVIGLAIAIYIVIGIIVVKILAEIVTGPKDKK